MELLAVQPRSAPELADGLGVHVRTARRILRRLQGDGYVVLSSDRRRRYPPTMRVVALAGQVVARAELTQTARPHLTALQQELGVDCHLCVPSYLSALCLVHAAGKGAGGCRPQLRELVPCHCTAAGKALLAWRDSWRDAVLSQPLAPLTEHTRTGPDWLRGELGRTVARGYSIEDREFEPQTRGIGAPVFSANGEAVAAVAAVASLAQRPAERYALVGEAVTRAADQLSAQLRSERASPAHDRPIA